MADNYLITGYWGEPHVTAENDRGINAGIFGTGRFVLPVGEQFKAEYIGNNTIRLYDGKLIDNGAAAGIPAGRYIDLLISNAGQGMKRNDLIVFQYSKDVSTLIETGSFVVIQGAETSGTAVDPALTQADLLSDEAVLEQFPLWRVSVSGTAISSPVRVYELFERGGGAKFQTGSYAGTGAAGANNPCKITFDDVPLLVMLFNSFALASSTALPNGFIFNVAGLKTEYTAACFVSKNSETFAFYVKKSADGKSIFWYVEHKSNGEVVADGVTATEQFNYAGNTYTYLGIG